MYCPSEQELIDRYIPNDARREIGLAEAVAVLAAKLPDEFWRFWEEEMNWDLEDLFEYYQAGCLFKCQRAVDFSLGKIIAAVSRWNGFSKLEWCLENVAPEGSALRLRQAEWLVQASLSFESSNDHKQLDSLFQLKLWQHCPEDYQYLRSLILNRIAQLEAADPAAYGFEQLLNSARFAAELDNYEPIYSLKPALESCHLDFRKAVHYWRVASGFDQSSPGFDLGPLLAKYYFDREYLIKLFRLKMEESVGKFIEGAKKRGRNNNGCWAVAKDLPANDPLARQLWQAECEIIEAGGESGQDWRDYQSWCLIYRDSPAGSEFEQKAYEFLSANPPKNWYQLRFLRLIEDCGKSGACDLFYVQLEKFQAAV